VLLIGPHSIGYTDGVGPIFTDADTSSLRISLAGLSAPRTWTAPNSDLTVVGTTTTQTLTNKTLTSPTINTPTFGGNLTSTGVAFAALGTPSNGVFIFCSDCTKATPCAGSGNGALAKRLNGAWDCD
jgi:hypothetical protein